MLSRNELHSVRCLRDIGFHTTSRASWLDNLDLAKECVVRLREFTLLGHRDRKVSKNWLNWHARRLSQVCS
ncbi:hypothetical protein D3C72_2233150 [compost metagenome]